MENIQYGRDGATKEEAIAAARVAGAHAFVSALPQGYGSEVGERGAQLSGGQKQRVAIARAIVRDPSILLLDEPTSAREIQMALDEMLQTNSRTTLVVTHRLSTIQNADKICVIDAGSVVESGTHQELLSSPTGAYHRLMRAQLALTENVAQSQQQQHQAPPSATATSGASGSAVASAASAAFSVAAAASAAASVTTAALAPQQSHTPAQSSSSPGVPTPSAASAAAPASSAASAAAPAFAPTAGGSSA